MGGYKGELIDIRKVLEDIKRTALCNRWLVESVPLHLTGMAGNFEFLAVKRIVPNAIQRIYVSAGIHGDEPAGPLAVLRLLQENCWPENVSLWLCPCLNPAGFLVNRRENDDGVDLNRDYKSKKSPEINAHISWLEKQPSFDVTLCLHEDWESSGFYLYELNSNGGRSFAKEILQSAARICPIDHSTMIEGRLAHGGLIQPPPNPTERPLWPESIFLINSKTQLSYTVEAPSDFELGLRVSALVTSVRTVLDAGK